MSISHMKILGVVFITSIVIAFPAFAAQLADGTPPPNGGYVAGDTILDPGCAPGDVDCYTNIGGGGSGWSLTGDAGTTVGTNFIGTTDAEDFMVKVNDVQVGLFSQNGAIALGSDFADYLAVAPVASGDHSFAMGYDTEASGTGSFAGGYGSEASRENGFAWGSFTTSSGDGSVAFGQGTTASALNAFAINESTIASGARSFAQGNNTTASGERAASFGEQTIALGDNSFVQGRNTSAESFNEITFGFYSTDYVPFSTTSVGANDRLFNIGNGGGLALESDAFTILKSGETGIGIDNFEANTNGNIFQVGDGTTNIIGYVDDVTGNWVAVSDERQKDNIKNLTYGLDEINQLRPVSFDYKRNGEHTIGFIAQETMDIIPEAVFGSEDKGYGMSYQTLTPVLVQAVQELDVKVATLSAISQDDFRSGIDSLVEYVFEKIQSAKELVIDTLRARTVQVETLCVGDTCIDENTLQQVLGTLSTTPEISRDDVVVSEKKEELTEIVPEEQEIIPEIVPEEIIDDTQQEPIEEDPEIITNNQEQ